MTWIIPPEVFTTEFRAKGNAIVQVVHYSISLVIVGSLRLWWIRAYKLTHPWTCRHNAPQLHWPELAGDTM